MVTALASQLTGRPVRGDIAMTGEITLSGRVLPVGGIKEKVLAARRHGITEVILPRQNEKHINEDLTDELRRELTIHYVIHIEEVLALALLPSSAQTHAGVPLTTSSGRRFSSERSGPAARAAPVRRPSSCRQFRRAGPCRAPRRW